METTVTLLHSGHKSKQMNTLEIYYIHYFHQYNKIIKEQTQKQKKLNLFALIQDTQFHQASA
jgi:hypothetical protein